MDGDPPNRGLVAPYDGRNVRPDAGYERWTRLRASMLVAGAASMLLFVALTMGGGGDSGGSMLLDESYGSAGALALSELKIGRSRAMASNPSPVAARNTMRTGMAPSRAPVQKQAPAQRLDQILAQGSHDRPLPMLEEKDVKRALACPLGHRCSFTSRSTMEERSKVTEYESKGENTIEPEAHAKVSDITAGMTLFFDVYETNAIGCTAGHVVYALNFTKVEEEDVVVTENGRKADTEHAGSEKEVLTTLNLNTFYVLQDVASGTFVNFVSPSTELKMYLDLKRSIFKELNPVIDTAAETAIGPAGERLFVHYEHDLNGRYHTSVMLRQDEQGRTETQHIKRVGFSESLYEEEEPQVFPSNGATEGTCPYPEPNKEKGYGEQKKTATSHGGAVESSDDHAHTKIGEAPNSVEEANKQSARDEEKSGQNPMGGSLEITVEYEVSRVGSYPQLGACSAANDTAEAPSPAAPPALASMPHEQSLFQWRANAEKLTLTSEGVKAGMHDETDAKMVVRPFKTHMLYDASEEEANKVMPLARAQATVQHLIEGISAANKPDEKIDTKGLTELREVCHNHQLRSIMFKWLATPDAAKDKNRRVVVKLMSSCGVLLSSSTAKLSYEDKAGKGKDSILSDLSALINNDKAPEFVRDAGLQALVDLECPTSKTLEEVNMLGTSLHGSALGETATLTLGALLRKHRYCQEGKPAASSKKASPNSQSQILAFDPQGPSASSTKALSTELASNPAVGQESSHPPGRVFEAALNARLASAVRHLDTDDAETTLLAMANSASPVHLLAVARSLESNKEMMRSLELRQAVRMCIKSIGEHGGGDAGNDSTELLQKYEADEGNGRTTMLSTVDLRADKTVNAKDSKQGFGDWKADFWFASAEKGKTFLKKTAEFAWRGFFIQDFKKVFTGSPKLIKDASVISMYNPQTFKKYVEEAKASEKFWVGANWGGQIFFKKKGTYKIRMNSGGGSAMIEIADPSRDMDKEEGALFRLTNFQRSVFQWFTPKDQFAIKNSKTGVVRSYGDWYMGSDDEMTDGQTITSRATETVAATFQMCNLYVYKTYEMAELWETGDSFLSSSECKESKAQLEEQYSCNADEEDTNEDNEDTNEDNEAMCRSIEVIECGKKDGMELVLTEDGIVGLFHKSDVERLIPAWAFDIPSSKLSQYPPSSYFYRLLVKGDGRLVLHAFPIGNKCKNSFQSKSPELWSSNEEDGFSDEDQDYLTTLKAGTNYLESGGGCNGQSRADTLKANSKITSQNGIYELAMVTKGKKQGTEAKLVGKPLLWRTDVPNKPNCKGVMTDWGAFKIMDGGSQKFTTSTSKSAPAGTDNGPFQLVMQRDGLLVIYNQWRSKVWASGDEKHIRGLEEDSDQVFVSDMNAASPERDLVITDDDTAKKMRVRFGGMLDHASISVEYSGPDTGNEWVALSAYDGGDQTPIGENVDLVTLPTPPPEEEEDEDEEEDEEEDALDPASCKGGEDPLVCYGKRIPESGAVRGLLSLDAGKAEAKEVGNGGKCQNYGFVRGTASAEIYTGLPWEGWDPFSIDILVLEGRYLMGPKCKCAKIGVNTCPTRKECKAANKLPAKKKVSKADGKKKVGGHFSIFGFVLKKFGKLNLQDPHSDADGGSLIPKPPGGEVDSSGLFKSLQYSSIEAIEPPVKRWGFCGFEASEYSLAEKETTKQKKLRVLSALGMWIGPVRIGIEGHIKLAMGGEIGVTANHQDPEQLFNGKAAECKDGGRSGQGTAYVKTVMEISGSASIVFASANLGFELTFFSAQATGNAELLSGGFGKEAYIGFQAISGEIFAALRLAVFTFDWWCAGRFNRGKKRCYLWLPDISMELVDKWRKTLWSFKSVHDSGNLLCDKMSDVGCAEFEENAGAKLFQILRTVDAFKEAVEKLIDDVASNNLELQAEESKQVAAESALKTAKRKEATATQELHVFESRRDDLEELVATDTHNIEYWDNYKNSYYYQFSRFDKSRTPAIVCNEITKADILKNNNLKNLPEGVEWRDAPITDLDKGHTVQAFQNEHARAGGHAVINTRDGGVASDYKAGGVHRRRLLSPTDSPEHEPAALVAGVPSAASLATSASPSAPQIPAEAPGPEAHGDGLETLPDESPAALKATLWKALNLKADDGSELDSLLVEPEEDPEDSILQQPRSQEANASLQGRLEMLGWRQRAAARRAARRAERERRARERAARRAERQRKLQEWLEKKKLDEIAKKAAYASSIRRQLGDLDVRGAENSVGKSKKFVDAVLNDIDTENYGFWRSKSARAMFFKHVDSAYKKCDNAKQKYQNSWLWESDKKERIANAERVRMTAVAEEAKVWEKVYEQAEEGLKSGIDKLHGCYNFNKHIESPDENLYKQAVDCKIEVEGFRAEASKAQDLEDRQSLFPDGLPGFPSIDFDNFDERKKTFEDELDQYKIELKAWEEKIWDDFVEHHRESDPCFYHESGAYNGVDPWCYQTTFTSAACLVYQDRYEDDVARRVSNIEKARKTIDDSEAEINEIERPGGKIALKNEEIVQLEEVVSAKLQVKISWDDKVRQRIGGIELLKTTREKYDDAKKVWEDAKAKVEQFLTFVGMCAYQDVDPVSGRRMRMLYQVPPTKTPLIAPSKVVSDLASKSSAPTTQLAQASKSDFPVGSAGHETGCAYIDPQGGDYRGLADVDKHGRQCLPWPKSYALKYSGSGIAKNVEQCDDLVEMSPCWESCKFHQETNNYCRNPTDADMPYCRIGGTEEEPAFSPCGLKMCQDTGCTHNLKDQSDYEGMVHQSENGDMCLDWIEFPEYASVASTNGWANSCRNLADGDMARAWCFTGTVDDATKAYCDIGRQCSDVDGPVDDTDKPPSSASLSDASTSGSKARSATLMYESQAKEARAQLIMQMRSLGHTMSSDL